MTEARESESEPSAPATSGLALNDLPALSVRRPLLAMVLNLLIALAGVAAVLAVEVRELPNVDRPIVTVRGILQGASPETMDREVTSLVEGAVARVSGVKEIRSSSEENNFRMRAEFGPGTDLDTAASDVREAVSRVQRDLPDEIEQLVVVKDRRERRHSGIHLGRRRRRCDPVRRPPAASSGGPRSDAVERLPDVGHRRD
jgi:hypothetical protein